MKTLIITNRKFHMLAVFAAIGFSGIALAQRAQQAEKADIKVNQLSQRPIIEKLDGKEASATSIEVAFGPGQKDTLHRHAGPVFGYVLEGEYEHAINDEPVKTYKAGDTFYEPTGCVHRVAANPSNRSRTRLMVVILHPRDVKEVTVWEKGNH
jgi:quercetin dioxygenase-like cupin family protein